MKNLISTIEKVLEKITDQRTAALIIGFLIFVYGVCSLDKKTDTPANASAEESEKE